MKTLKLTLSGPMASFGTTMRLQHRLSDVWPSRTAILGLIACAMGLERNTPRSTLDAITVSVLSASYEGSEVGMSIDFQTIRNAVTVDGDSGRNAITYRQYMTRYHSEVEISGPDSLIQDVEKALRKPKWQLYLGRRAHVLDRPVLAKAA